VSGANTALSVSVAGNDVTVNVATTAGSAAKSTAEEVMKAVNASTAARALLSAETTGSGTTAVGAAAMTNLSGGAS
jgi:hypothetical protein